MKKKLFGVLIYLLLITSVMHATGLNLDNELAKENPRVSEALIPPDIYNQVHTIHLSPEPGFYETSEYMIGSIAVGVIFLESNGGIDPNTENWAPVEELNVQQEIAYALTQWWDSQNSNAGVSFIIEWRTGVPTSYEPIIHASAVTDDTYEKLWVSEAMAYLGYNSGDWMQRTRTYINSLRQSKGTDWAYAIFVIDSTNDKLTDPYTPGSFSDNYNAYAYTGGPFAVMTYDNGAWGITNMDQVISHETGHIFWATDEYNHMIEYSGYLNARDNDGSGCVMDTTALCLSTGTQQQIGWRDTDGDSILDIIDTNPDTSLIPYIPDPTTSTTLIYSGSAMVVPYPNNNPCWWNSGNNVTINTISNVRYRVNGGGWQNANPVDGFYNSFKEDFTMTIGPLTPGLYTIEAQAQNSVGNYDITPDSDTVTIVTGNTPPAKPSQPSGQTNGKIGQEYPYTTSSTDPEGDQVYYLWDWGDGNNSGWLGPYNSGATCEAKYTWKVKNTYSIKVKAKDIYGAESPWSDPLPITMPYTFKPILHFLELLFQRFPNAFPILRQPMGY